MWLLPRSPVRWEAVALHVPEVRRTIKQQAKVLKGQRGLKMEHTNNLWKGRPLEYWIETLQDPDDEARWGAIDALRHIADPSQSIPLFVRFLSDRYWRARALAVHALYDMAFEVEFVSLLSQAVTPLANALSD
jgi:HEAT repeat protein